MDGFFAGDVTHLPCAITLSFYPGTLQIMEGFTEVTYIGWTDSLAPLWFIEQYIRRYKLVQVYWQSSSDGMQKPVSNMIVPQGYTPDPTLLQSLPSAFLKAIGYHQVQLPQLSKV